MPRLFLLSVALLVLGPSLPFDAEVREATPTGGLATPVTPEPLDEATLQGLAIHGFAIDQEPDVINLGTLGATIGLSPGGAIALVLGVFDYEICGAGIRCFVPVPALATWSVSPTDGALIDPATGVLTIDPATPSGSLFTVRADIESGRHVVEAEVHVYTLEANPLIGYWLEEVQLACGSGAEIVPELPIEELVFAADGTFAVTWMPFESYVDYWGTYSFDLAQGTLDLVATGGNYVPPDIDGHGRVALDEAGRLVLTEIWLGTSHSPGTEPHCGHRFVR